MPSPEDSTDHSPYGRLGGRNGEYGKLRLTEAVCWGYLLRFDDFSYSILLNECLRPRRDRLAEFNEVALRFRLVHDDSLMLNIEGEFILTFARADHDQ